MTFLKVNKWQTAAGDTVSNVIQTKIFNYSTTQTFSNTADGVAQTTALTLAITPKFATSKIYVTASCNISYNNNSSVARGRIIRTGPSTAYSTSSSASSMSGWTTCHYLGESATGNAMMGPNYNITWTDSPASTSTCTYTLQLASNGGNSSMYLNGNGTWGGDWGGSSYIILMEIAQ